MEIRTLPVIVCLGCGKPYANEECCNSGWGLLEHFKKQNDGKYPFEAYTVNKHRLIDLISIIYMIERHEETYSEFVSRMLDNLL